MRRRRTACTRRSVWSCVRLASAPDPTPRRTARKNSLTFCMLGITVYVHACSLVSICPSSCPCADAYIVLFYRCRTSCSTTSNDLLQHKLPYATVKCVTAKKCKIRAVQFIFLLFSCKLISKLHFPYAQQTERLPFKLSDCLCDERVEAVRGCVQICLKL